MIPAIDLRGGRCVRLFQGDYARETVYGDDPVGVARRWEALGAPRLHVVDLDGAKDGRPANSGVMAAICAGVAIPVEVSGGMRTTADIEAAFAYGAARVQIGSAAVRDPGLVDQALALRPADIVVSIDCRDGQVFAGGWRDETGMDAFELAQAMVERGVRRLMVTDIARDGTMGGPNVGLLERFVKALPVPIVASGGVTTAEHLAALATAGCEGAIVGKALYEGALTLPQALAAVS